MRIAWIVFPVMLVTWLYGAAVPVAAETESPTQLVQRLLQAIRSIKPAANGTLSETQRAHNTEAITIAHAILDIPAVSQRTLGQHWASRTPAEQQEFMDLLMRLFAKVAYPKSAEFFSDLDVSVIRERIQGERAVVMTAVKHPKEGLVAVDYNLARQNGSWYVHDILLDDVSLALNLRSQFHKIITENSYKELLRRMQEKLDE